MDDCFYEDVAKRLRSLIESNSSFSDAEQAEILHFLDFGEFGLALETAFAIALEHPRRLKTGDKIAMKRLAVDMGLSDTIDTDRLL